jgi:hypothetical protein
VLFPSEKPDTRRYPSLLYLLQGWESWRGEHALSVEFLKKRVSWFCLPPASLASVEKYSRFMLACRLCSLQFFSPQRVQRAPCRNVQDSQMIAAQ